jgi:spore coat polysaccharide biosynthesis protein SpsF
MKTVAVIQARMASSRLPGKVLVDLAGEPMLQHVVRRAAWAATLNSVVVATSTAPSDDPVVRFCKNRGVAVFRGSLEDVLDRYYRASELFAADAIVRLTADCPLLDPRVIDRVVRVFLQGDYDYVSNVLECTYPDGLDTEVIGRAALERCWREARLKSEREHVTPYIYKHPDRFKVCNVRHSEDLSAYRWTVDEPRDLEVVRVILGRLGRRKFGMDDIVALLRAEPGLLELNKDIRRNAGYLKSLQEDLPAA